MAQQWRVCELCDTEYTTSIGSRSRWCSHECHGIAQRNVANRRCIVCHRPFRWRADREDCCTWRCFEAHVAAGMTLAVS